MKRSSRNRLTPGQARHFPGDGLYERIARALCATGCVPRKEFFESWSFVHRVRRHVDAPEVWDLCAGHGLVSLFLALLEPDLERVVAVDRRQPASHAKVRAALEAIDASRVAKVRYEERKLEDLGALPERVFVVAVHACGHRTDRAIDLAIASRSSVAVLPCCHDVARVEVPNAVLARWSKRDAVDLARIFRLHAAGYRTYARRVEDDVTSCADAILGLAPPA